MKPECRYGLLCERQSSEHWINFSHPASPRSTVQFQVDETELKHGQSCVDSEKQVPLNQNTTNSTTGSSKVVLLMLVGLPGSGKSTFCDKLLQSNPSKWRRICQDIVSNGKRGTKEQCLKLAEKALNQGFNVMIDRCNLAKDQRRDFLQLARRLHAQAEALVLDLPVKTCIQRAIQRKGHEGGLEGKSAPAAIGRMAQGKEMPVELEGFSVIVTCHTEEDVVKALNIYQESQVVDNQGKAVVPPAHFFGKPADKSSPRAGQGVKECSINNGIGRSIDDGSRTLAFPSISTSDFQFDHERAAKIIVEVAYDFLIEFKKYRLRLSLVDLKEDSDILVRVRQKAAACGLRSEDFMAIAGDITKLRSSCRLQCNFVANATNWRLKPGGGGVNAAIFKAAGEELENETKQRAKTLNPGSALVVPLSPTSPLYVTEGVTHIIHVLGPNMNPQRPNCLQGDYIEGCKVLRDAYSCMFRAFASQVESQSANPIGQSSGVSPLTAKPRDAFAVLMQSTKRKSVIAGSELKAKHSRQDTGQEEADVKLEYGSNVQEHINSGSIDCEGEAQRPNERFKSKKWETWAEALRKMALHPEQFRDMILQVTEQTIVIIDKFPKGRKHLLVVSRLDGLDSLDDLRSSHLPLLQDMHNLGMTLVQSSLQQDHSLVFRMGYHSDPSMRQLHMHIISQDFDSPALKNKKHWNSFTTAFFRDSKGVIEELRDTGRVKPFGDESSLLKLELRCHRCQSVQPNIPRLKQHIGSCQVSFPSDLVQKGFVIMK
eukprot:c13818_g1_i1 orf=361-2667(-)